MLKLSTSQGTILVLTCVFSSVQCGTRVVLTCAQDFGVDVVSLDMFVLPDVGLKILGLDLLYRLVHWRNIGSCFDVLNFLCAWHSALVLDSAQDPGGGDSRLDMLAVLDVRVRIIVPPPSRAPV